jgi:asparagine synthase (glutamine-hydrolysing)
MCGIYGRVERGGGVTAEALARQVAVLAHRGPDDTGNWVADSGRVGLAHRRLSVIDLSPTGHQPMRSTDGRLTIVFNGEIYNFRELRSELEELGSRFVSTSDTEVLLAGYRAWDAGCLSKLNGMFAFVIHDAGGADSAPSLFFARDRAGEKPFYYVAERGFFEFASELKGLTRRGGLDLNALNHYLALGYVPGELCLAQGVHKLPPAHAGRLDLATFELKLWKYWSLPANKSGGKGDSGSLAGEAQKILFDSVRLRMQSDVPLGVLLSGGLDSSLVVAAAARQSQRPVKTFTITLPGSPLDESRYASTVARYFGTEHHELALAGAGLGAFDDFAPLVDEPVADSSLIPSFLVSRLTRRHVTVALGGDGGDELFGGYLDYPASLADERRLGWLPAFALRAAAAVAGRLPAGVRGRNRCAALRGGPLQQIIWGSPYFDLGLRRRILGLDAVSDLSTGFDAPERSVLALFNSGRGPVDRLTRLHFGSTLPDDFLVKVDRASMAHALEMRSPMLDHRLIEFCFEKVPDEWKVHGRDTRRLEKLIARRLLPPDLDLERKQGFSVPLDDWLRAESPAVLDGRLASLPACIDRTEAAALIRGLRAGRANGARIFALIMLSIAAANLGWTS